MDSRKIDKGKASGNRDMEVQCQIAFASGLFQGDLTIRTILESLAEGVIVVNKSGTILLVNTSAERMFGYQSEELVGCHHSISFQSGSAKRLKSMFRISSELPKTHHWGISPTSWDCARMAASSTCNSV